MSQLCERCAAVAKNTRQRCRNFSQCRTKIGQKDYPLCYVHSEQMRRSGVKNFFIAESESTKSIQKGIQSVDDRLARIEQALFDRSATEQRLFRIENAVFDSKPLNDGRNAQNHATVMSSIFPVSQNGAGEPTAPKQSISNQDRLGAIFGVSQNSAVEPSPSNNLDQSRLGAFYPELDRPNSIAPTVAQDAVVQPSILGALYPDLQVQPPAPKKSISDVVQKEPISDQGKKESPLPSKVDETSAAERAFFDRVDRFARIVSAETVVAESMIEQFCPPLTDDGFMIGTVSKAKEFYDFNSKIDAFLALAIAAITESKENIKDFSKDLDNLQVLYADEKQKLMDSLDRDCKLKSGSSWYINLKLALDWASGKIECQGDSMPTEMRTWYTSEATDAKGRVWTNKQVLCNVEPNSALTSVGAFKPNQRLENQFRVHDSLDRFVTIGKLGEKKKEPSEEEPLKEPVRMQDSIADRRQTGIKEMQKYVNWLATLERLITLASLLGLDPSKLLFEKQQVNLSLATLVVSLGQDVALQYFTAEQFANMSTLASLATTYQSYLSTGIGVAGLANLAAYNAHLHFKDKVSKPQLARITRYAFANAFQALLGIGGAGALASLLWFNTTVQPARVTPMTGPESQSVPVLKSGSQVYYALRDIGTQTILLTPPELAALQTPESAGFLRESLQQTTRTLFRNAQALASASESLKEPESRLAVYYGSLFTKAYQGIPRTRQQYELAQQTPLSLWIDPANSEISKSVQTYLAGEQPLRGGGVASKAELKRLRDQANALGLPISSNMQPRFAQPMLNSSSEAAGVPASLRADMLNQSAIAAGTSLATVLGLLVQAKANPQIPKIVRDFSQDFLLANDQVSAFAGAMQSPLENQSYFTSAKNFTDAARLGMQQIRRADLKLLLPDEQMRLDRPEIALSLQTAINAAADKISDADYLFDDDVINFGDLEKRADANGIWPFAFSDEVFLLQLSGASVGGLSGADAVQLQNYFRNLETNATAAGAFDAQMQKLFAEFDRAQGSTTRAMAQDVTAIVSSISEFDKNIAQRTQKALKSRDVRNLFLSSSENYNGFLRGILESGTSSQSYSEAFDQSVVRSASLQAQLTAFVDNTTAYKIAQRLLETESRGKIIESAGIADAAEKKIAPNSIDSAEQVELTNYRIRKIIESAGIASATAKYIAVNFIDSAQQVGSILRGIPNLVEIISVDVMQGASAVSADISQFIMNNSAKVASLIDSADRSIRSNVPTVVNLLDAGADKTFTLFDQRGLNAIESLSEEILQEIVADAYHLSIKTFEFAESGALSAKEMIKSIPLEQVIFSIDNVSRYLQQQVPEVAAEAKEKTMQALAAIKASSAQSLISLERQMAALVKSWSQQVLKQVPPAAQLNATELERAEKKFLDQVLDASRVYANMSFNAQNPLFVDRATEKAFPITGKTLNAMLADAQRNFIDETVRLFDVEFQKQTTNDTNPAAPVLPYSAEVDLRSLQSQLTRSLSIWSTEQQQSFANKIGAPVSNLFENYLEANAATKKTVYEALGPQSVQNQQQAAENISLWYNNEFERLGLGPLSGKISAENVEQIEQGLARNQKIQNELEEEQKLTFIETKKVNQCISSGISSSKCSILLGLPEKLVNDAWNLSNASQKKERSTDALIQTYLSNSIDFYKTAACLLNEPISSGWLWILFSVPDYLRRVKKENWNLEQLKACTAKLNLPSEFAMEFLEKYPLNAKKDSSTSTDFTVQTFTNFLVGQAGSSQNIETALPQPSAASSSGSTIPVMTKAP